MKKRIRAVVFALTLIALAAPLAAQQQVEVDIFGNQAASTVKLAYPFPTTGSEVSRQTIEDHFNRTMLHDLAFAEIF